jgi:hypothetical protein
VPTNGQNESQQRAEKRPSIALNGHRSLNNATMVRPGSLNKTNNAKILGQQKAKRWATWAKHMPLGPFLFYFIFLSIFFLFFFFFILNETKP